MVMPAALFFFALIYGHFLNFGTALTLALTLPKFIFALPYPRTLDLVLFPFFSAGIGRDESPVAPPNLLRVLKLVPITARL